MTNAVLVLNILWFSLGFHFFALRPRQAVRLLLPPETREERSRQAMVEALPFLGGMNAAWAALSLAQLAIGHSAPPTVVLLGSGIAHASQFACNVPAAYRGGRAGGAAWDVLRGPMRFIFIVDGVCALANGLAIALA